MVNPYLYCYEKRNTVKIDNNSRYRRNCGILHGRK